MKKVILSFAAALAAVSLFGDIVAYVFTAQNTPATVKAGEVIGVQACSTNESGVASVCAVTDLDVGGSLVSFTNCLSSVTLVDGVGGYATNGVFVSSRQRVVVSGDAFPGGAIFVWVKE